MFNGTEVGKHAVTSDIEKSFNTVFLNIMLHQTKTIYLH